MNDVLLGILIPFLGTTLGAGCVFFLRGKLNLSIERGLTGFAAGIMVAASFFSLLIPALNETTDMGKWGFVPPVIGFGIGMGFLLLLDHLIPHLHMHADKAEGPKSHLAKTTMLVLAVTLHNIPEGMATGVVYAGFLSGHAGITLAAASSLAIGIAIQNFPEGAIISMPLMPYFLSFAAGAMMYVVVEELIPEMSAGEHSHVGVISFAIGFMIMMSLDVALG